MNDTRALFVYGTLRRDPAHKLYHLLARHARFLGDASVRGRLYDLGSYPGMVLSDQNDVVVGELYEIQTNWVDVIDQLDEYEGCASSDPLPHEYRREIVEALRPNGERIHAWAYVLNRDPQRLRRIESGDYLAWRNTFDKSAAQG